MKCFFFLRVRGWLKGPEFKLQYCQKKKEKKKKWFLMMENKQ
jgi:hypothetical protein